MQRRKFLRAGLVGVAGLAGGLAAAAAQDEEGAEVPGQLRTRGAILNVHDPVAIKQDDWWYLFSTGVGIPVRRSADLLDWRIARGGSVFQRLPKTSAWVPDAPDIWAPDISWYNGRYHLYFSVSGFGLQRSAIGLATNRTLHYDDPDFAWEDQGIVITSAPGARYNAIDPNLALDEEGQPWLAFGSFWQGIHAVRLDEATGLRADDEVHWLAGRPAEPPHAVEAPFIVRRGDWYYLFVSFDACCDGIHSTYNVRVGRAEAITGPYHDRDGTPMQQGGGTQVTWPTSRYVGPGHNAIIQSEEGQDYMLYHAYDRVQGGVPSLRVAGIAWDEDGWPGIPGMEPEQA